MQTPPVLPGSHHIRRPGPHTFPDLFLHLLPPVFRVPRLPCCPGPAPPPPPAPIPTPVRAAQGSRACGSHPRVSQKLCSGKLGIAMKVLGGVALFWVVFILGYITGYYVHKCQ